MSLMTRKASCAIKCAYRILYAEDDTGCGGCDGDMCDEPGCAIELP